MFPNALFNNPWHSWRSPNHLEDAQTISESNLFDEDMTPTCDPGDHTIGTTTLAQSQLDSLPPAAHAQADPPTSVVPPDSMVYAAGRHMVLESERDIDVQKLHVLSQHNTPEPEHMSTSNASTGKRTEPDTPTNRGISIEGNVAPLPTSKCRFEEVDFSRSLRQALYEKEEVINKLQKRVRQQGRQNDVVSDLQSVLKQRENELSGLREALQQVQSVQERTAQQYETQLEELQKQFESSVQSHIDKLQAAKMAEIETHVREEVTRLGSMLQAEKERELANIEQRYARLKKPVRPGKHLDAEIASSAEPHLTHPRATPSTLHLDAIKRIRKSRGVSNRTRLIGVDIDDNGSDPEFTLSEGHEEGTGEKAARNTQNDQPDPPPVSVMVEAVTRSVETTLKTLFENGSHFAVGAVPRSRRTPWRRRQENYKLQIEKATEPSYHRDFILAEVCCLFREKLGITQDIDFITHKPANAVDVRAYEHEDGPGPDTDNIAFDLARNHKSLWNTFILGFLLRELQLCCVHETWPICKDDNYIEEILQERYKRLRTLWRNAQPKLTATGSIETPAEQEARLVKESQRLGKESRQTTHRRNKYRRRKAVLDGIVAMKSEVPDDDLRSWKWLQRLIVSLGEHGMSSEESSVENGIESVLRVKKLEWQKNIDKELEIVDLQRVLDQDIFCPQGSKPLPRKRAPDNPMSSRIPVKGLPMALYDDTWISRLTERQRESLQISKEPFPWMKLVAA